MIGLPLYRKNSHVYYTGGWRWGESFWKLMWENLIPSRCNLSWHLVQSLSVASGVTSGKWLKFTLNLDFLFWKVEAITILIRQDWRLNATTCGKCVIKIDCHCSKNRPRSRIPADFSLPYSSCHFISIYPISILILLNIHYTCVMLQV